MARTALFKLLEPAERPRWHRAYGLGERWWTWSLEARRFLMAERRELESLRLESTNVVHNDYPTALLPVPGHRLRQLLDHVVPLSDGMRSLVPEIEPRFLCGLFRPPLSPKAVSHFCALLARAQNDRRPGPAPAMFVPPNQSPISSDFLPHSDLFPRRRLLIVYDQVAAPEWSESLLLPWAQAFPVLRSSGMPARSLARIRKLLSIRVAADGFDELFKLLYDDKVPHGKRVMEAFRTVSTCVPFRRGEGYLLDDRRWLHGRRLTRGATTRARFRRLVF